MSPPSKASLQELALVLCVGVLLAFLANAMSPRGLDLSKDYFHQHTALPSTPSIDSANADSGPLPGVKEKPVPIPSAENAIAARLAAKGLLFVGHEQVFELFQDPAYLIGDIVFVDARKTAAYLAGHIPKAYQFDHYQMEAYVDQVYPACEIAARIIVYCNGGECEDSGLVAMDLIQLGIPAKSIHIYLGGITKWQSQGGSIELGHRDSGILQ